MANVVDLEKVRLEVKAARGFRNWKSRFGEDFGPSTRLDHLSDKTLSFLALGKGDSPFFLYDLIMNLLGLGSGFEHHDLNTKKKMMVMDQFLFLLDRIRFEYMKRLGWLESYPGEDLAITELIMTYDRVAPGMQARPPVLHRDHPDYPKYSKMNLFGKEEFIRRLVPQALKKIQSQSTTL